MQQRLTTSSTIFGRRGLVQIGQHFLNFLRIMDTLFREVESCSTRLFPHTSTSRVLGPSSHLQVTPGLMLMLANQMEQTSVQRSVADRTTLLTTACTILRIMEACWKMKSIQMLHGLVWRKQLIIGRRRNSRSLLDKGSTAPISRSIVGGILLYSSSKCYFNFFFPLHSCLFSFLFICLMQWNIPQENYENIESDPPEAKHKVFPATRPHIHFHDCAEMSHAYFDDNGWGVPLSQGGYWVTHQAEMRRAYYGALNYVDGMIGKALEILDERGVANDTIVMVTGDHGWHLGEFDEWCKMTNLELGTRVPLIFRAPFMKHSVGAKTSALAELVDLYPTLADLAGVPLPKENEGGEYLGGVSLKPIFEDPSSKVKDVALSQFPRCWQNNTHHSPHHKVGDESNFTVSWESMSDCHWTERNGLDFMGYRIRTSNFSFTQWFRWNMSDLRPIWKDVVGTELYDHTNDTGMAPSAFDDYEVINLAGNPAYADVQKSMTTLLKEEVLRWITPNP
eukprot:m.210314 g.210314  ORF g.210314 m.210314 type:complete len:507 (+) comp13779_c2_seq37:810-2330(+)